MKRKQSARTKAPLPRATIIAGARTIIPQIIVLFVVFLVLGVGGFISQLPSKVACPNPSNRYKTLNLWLCNVPHIGFQSHWTVVDFARDVHNVVKLREIVNMGEETLSLSADSTNDVVSNGAADDPNADFNWADRDWVFDMVVEAEAARVRADLVHRIDAFLASKGSPLAGLGNDFVWAQERTGVSATLMVGLTAAESTCATDGTLYRTHHNCFGMKGPQPQLGIPAEGGWCWWPDYGSSIQGAADFIIHYWGAAQTAYDLRGYCEGNPPSWIQTVEGTRRGI